MIKGILSTLKTSKGLESNQLRAAGFDYLIKNTDVYLIYSIKFEYTLEEFKSFLKYFTKPVIKDNENFMEDTNKICYEWYDYFIEKKSLFKGNSSLKSDLRRLYKKYTNSLNGFDRFFELIYNAFKEAYNSYDIVFYNPTAIEKNIDFKPDRDSCYITTTTDYLTAIKQARSYYVVIYSNGKPLTRVWFLVDKDYEHTAIFNQYGFKFKNLSQLFGDQDELKPGSHKILEKAIKVYVNDDTVLISSNTTDYNCFIYKLLCPYCKGVIRSNQMMLRYDEDDNAHRLKCPHCYPIVYSELYKDYIPEEKAVYSDYLKTYLYESDSVYSDYYETYIYESDAVYSNYLDTYLHRDDAIYSEYLDDYIPYDNAVKAQNDVGDWTWVPEEMAVYDTYDEGIYLIKEQSVYSKYYSTYISKKDAVYCDEIGSWIYPMDLRTAVEELAGTSGT